MRWSKKPEPRKPKLGEQKHVEKFLFFPKCLDGQWRWLEWALIIQEWSPYWALSPDARPYTSYKWKDVHWCDYPMNPIST